MPQFPSTQVQFWAARMLGLCLEEILIGEIFVTENKIQPSFHHVISPCSKSPCIDKEPSEMKVAAIFTHLVYFHGSTLVTLDSNYRTIFWVNSLSPVVIKIKEEIIQLNITINVVDWLLTITQLQQKDTLLFKFNNNTPIAVLKDKCQECYHFAEIKNCGCREVLYQELLLSIWLSKW